MVMVVVCEFGVMRCQPLRQALAVFRKPPNPREGKCTN
ncbi:acetyltransferase [Vibrio cholerae]|nr:acetyltransferase [Vibrio cholerae]